MKLSATVVLLLVHLSLLGQDKSDIAKVAQAVLKHPILVTFVKVDSSLVWGNPWLVSLKGLTPEDSLTYLNDPVLLNTTSEDTLSGTIGLTIDKCGKLDVYKVSGLITLYGPTIGTCTHANLLSFRCKVKSTKTGFKFSKFKTMERIRKALML